VPERKNSVVIINTPQKYKVKIKMEEENELEILSTGEELDAKKQVKEKEKFIDAMNKYYKLKNEYEESIQKMIDERSFFEFKDREN
jgi:hypothetical protein